MNNEIELIIDARSGDVGIPVKRILPVAKKRMVGPFIFLDHMGPSYLRSSVDHMDVRPHPHIGLSTLTYLFEGEILHRDSLGVEQVIVPGEVNWMTAGKGISHSEREPAGARFKDRFIHGLQFWVALPKELEDIEPSFHHYGASDIPSISTDALEIKVVAGSFGENRSNLKSYSPMTFLVLKSHKAGLFTFGEKGQELALYVVKGSVTVDGKTINETQMVVFKKDSTMEIHHSDDALFAVLGGEPFPEPRFIWWNLVSSSKEKIEEAKIAWENGSFPMVPGDFEKIPLPKL